MTVYMLRIFSSEYPCGTAALTEKNKNENALHQAVWRAFFALITKYL